MMESATIKIDELLLAKVQEDCGTEYKIKRIDVHAHDSGLDIIVEPVKIPLKHIAYRTQHPNFDGMAKYIFDCMVSEDLINPNCKIGTAKSRIAAFLKAASYVERNRNAAATGT